MKLQHLETIKTSLQYSLQRVRDYQHHPTHECKLSSLKPIEDAADAVYGEIARRKDRALEARAKRTYPNPMHSTDAEA